MSFTDLVTKELERKLRELGLPFDGLVDYELLAIRLCERRLGTQKCWFLQLVDGLVARREAENGGSVESIPGAS